MRAGRLKAYVDIQQRSKAQGRAGDQSNVWTTILSTWAEIKPLKGQALVAAQAQNADMTHQIVIRYPQGIQITIAHRVKWGTRIFDIRTPPSDPDMMQRELTFHAKEGLTNG